jgi:hypothetical protein
MNTELTKKRKLINFVPLNLFLSMSTLGVCFLISWDWSAQNAILFSFLCYFADVRISSLQDYSDYKHKFIEYELKELQAQVDKLKTDKNNILHG